MALRLLPNKSVATLKPFLSPSPLSAYPEEGRGEEAGLRVATSQPLGGWEVLATDLFVRRRRAMAEQPLDELPNDQHIPWAILVKMREDEGFLPPHPPTF